MPEHRWTMGRRALLEAAGAFGFAGLGAGLFWYFTRQDERDWEDVGDRPIRILSGRDDTANGQRRLLVEQWNTWHPGHPAEMVELPGVTDLQYSAIHAALQAEDPAVDVVNLDVPWVAGFASADHLEPLDGVDTGGVMRRPLDAGRFDGRLYALPFNTDVGMLYYRAGGESDYARGVLDRREAESITDWNALRDFARWILDANADFEGGVAMQLANYEGFTVSVWEYLLANGIEPSGEDRTIDFAEGSDAVGVLRELAADLREEVREGARVVLPDSLQFDEDDSLLAFQEGRTPFLRHWPRAYALLQACDLGFEVGVVPMPGGVLGGQSLAVSAHSTRRHVSRALVEFLTGPVSQQLLFERGGFAAARPEPYFDAIGRAQELGAVDPCEAAGGPRREARQLYEALDGGDGPALRPALERYTQFSRAFCDALHPELASSATPDLDGLTERLEEAAEGR